MMLDRVEILSVSLLDTERALVEEMRYISEKLKRPLGWHYLLDLSWAASQLRLAPGMEVLDAGAGTGIMQWWLAAQGVNVLSVDRNSRADLAGRFRSWCPTEGLRPVDLNAPALPGIKDFLPPRQPRFWHRWPLKLGQALARVAHKEPAPPPGRGKVTIYNQDLADMTDLPDDSVEAVVSISALEHNDPDSLRSIFRELMRVLRPGGMLVATLPAARDHDWFHQPSRAWCYTEASLRDIFKLAPGAPSNYDRYDDCFQALRECDRLRLALADSYFKSGDNGMPWGVWAPRYQPVGVVKVKEYE